MVKLSSAPGVKRTLLQEYIAQQTENNLLYWDVTNELEHNLEARWPLLPLQPRADYFEARNTLLLSPSLVSFLRGLAVRFDPLVIPILGSHVLRGLLSVLISSQSSSSAASKRDGNTDRTFTKRHNMTQCLSDKYDVLMGDRARKASMPMSLFLDTAVLDPLLMVYKTNLERSPGLTEGLNIPELPGKDAMELFFINFAVAHCQRPFRTTLGATLPSQSVSPNLRVNFVLMNSPVSNP